MTQFLLNAAYNNDDEACEKLFGCKNIEINTKAIIIAADHGNLKALDAMLGVSAEKSSGINGDKNFSFNVDAVKAIFENNPTISERLSNYKSMCECYAVSSYNEFAKDCGCEITKEDMVQPLKPKHKSRLSERTLEVH